LDAGRIAIITAYDRDAGLLFDAWNAAGGSASSGLRSLANTFIRAEKSAGTWQLTDDYWVLCAESAAQALVSWKQRRTATVTSAPTFTTNAGYAFDGLANFINTGFIASSHAVALTGTSQRLAVYERTNVTANTDAAGCQTTSTSRMEIRPRNGTAAAGLLNSTTAPTFTLGASDSRGYTAISRSGGATTMSAYKNGVALTDATGLTVGTSLPTHALYIGANNNAGTAASFRASTVGLVAIGAPLSAGGELAQYNNIQAHMTAIGANV